MWSALSRLWLSTGSINRHFAMVLLLGLGIVACRPLVGSTSNITAVWANDGGDKVTPDELRASKRTENLTGTVVNRVWDGTGVNLFGARNETVSFNLVIEAKGTPASNVTVTLDTLTGPGNARIHSVATSGNGVFNYLNRPIELFYTRYLKITGLSFFGYNKWDERQIPARFRRPANAQGQPTDSLGWLGRPDHDKYYPDPLVPLELCQPFQINAGDNQSIWVDIFIDKNLPSGTYTGNLMIRENAEITQTVHVALSVKPFTLPDESPRVFGNISNADVMHRFVNTSYVNWGSQDGRRVQAIMDRYYQLFHRHRMALIGENECPVEDKPCDSSWSRLSGSLYTAANNYDGPGIGVPTGIFSIGTYGGWSWKDSRESMWRHADSWASWFEGNLPGTDYFLYTQDEPQPHDYANVEKWSRWIKENPGIGRNLTSFATIAPIYAQDNIPSLDIPVYSASIGGCLNVTPCDNVKLNTAANDAYRNVGQRRLWAYNDNRPATGSLDTEDDGISPRVLGWSQFKMGIDKWFYWFINLDQQTNLFQEATTWYYRDQFDFSLGMVGPTATNGNGILAYPGTDLFNPGDSYNVDGPFASVRMKNWRRGLQDYDYLEIASHIDNTAVAQILGRVLPKTMWEIAAPDPTFYTAGGNSYSSDPDIWEGARSDLADIITNYCSGPSGTNDGLCRGNITTPSLISLNFTSSAVGSKITVSGANCPTGVYVLPYEIRMSSSASCSIEAIGPTGYSFSGWSDQANSNPRVIAALPVDQSFKAIFVKTSLPSASNDSKAAEVGLHFVPISPCRIADTRENVSAFGGPAFETGESREYLIAVSQCKIPMEAVAFSLNATVVPLKALRWLTIWPADQDQPFVSTLNSLDGRTKANGLLVKGSPSTAIKVFASEPTHLVLDVTGYFIDDSSQLLYHPLNPCRVLDTRPSLNSPTGASVPGNTELVVNIASSDCGISHSAKAYSLNFTAVPKWGSLGWMASWPAGRPRPVASVLNATTGSVTANNSIISAGQNGAISVFGSDDFDLIIDVNGYFDDQNETDGLLFYPMSPCRILDTREAAARRTIVGPSTVATSGSCGVPTVARVLASNITVIPTRPLAWLTAWMEGTERPLASVLNAPDGQITSNAVLAPLSLNGSFNIYVTDPTHVVIDANGYFAH